MCGGQTKAGEDRTCPPWDTGQAQPLHGHGVRDSSSQALLYIARARAMC